jgi:hypothetical protein
LYGKTFKNWNEKREKIKVKEIKVGKFGMKNARKKTERDKYEKKCKKFVAKNREEKIDKEKLAHIPKNVQNLTWEPWFKKYPKRSNGTR